MENQKTKGYKNPAQFAFIHILILIFLLSLSVRSLSLFSPSQTLIKEHRRFASVRRREQPPGNKPEIQTPQHELPFIFSPEFESEP
jgi:hypothetical protein